MTDADPEKAKVWDEAQAFLINQAEVTSPMHALARAKMPNHFNPYREAQDDNASGTR